MQTKSGNQPLKRILILTMLLCSVFVGCGKTQTVLRENPSGEPPTENSVSTEIEPTTADSVSTEIEPTTAAMPSTMAETEPAAPPNEIEKMLASMTLREKVCQMFFVTPESIAGIKPVTETNDAVRAALREYPVGGIIYSTGNLLSKEQVKQMLAETQNSTRIGLFLAADEEGGTVARLMKTVGTTSIGSMYDYRAEGVKKAHENACIIAADMTALGFNLDFAPVADVWSNPENTVIGKRAYSDDYREAAQLVAAAVQGFHDGGILCTLKHFPGHGDTAQDSHQKSAYVNRTRQELESGELLPFRAGIEKGADFVMVGHLIVPDVDERPATLSAILIQELLRSEMGYEGIVITDAMNMSALSNYYSTEEMAVLAVEAGNDMLLMPSDVKAAVDAIIQAAESGRLSKERIEESVRRILTVKFAKGIWKP